MIRTIIIEDDPAVIAKLRAALDPAPDIKVVGAAMTYGEGRRLIEKGEYEVLLTDLGLPDGNGIDLIRLSHKTHPESDVIVITIFANQNRVLDCIKAGARGYLLKDDRLEECADRVREVQAGGSPISPMIARQLLKQMIPEDAIVAKPLKDALSAREAEVLNLLARGFSYAEIADLHLQENGSQFAGGGGV
jgi:DNA-binding NarL/FixJ family response regulator